MSLNSDFEWFVEDSKSLKQGFNQTNITTSNVLFESIIKMVDDDDFASLEAFIKENAKPGRDLPYVNKSITSALQSDDFNYENYWRFVYTLLNHNAAIFLSTLSKNLTSRIALSYCDSELIDKIIQLSFDAETKLVHAIKLISVISNQLTFAQKNRILNSCLKTSNSDKLKLAFKSLSLPPEFVISFLRNKLDNQVVLYTLFDYYHDAYINNSISNDTVIEVFSLPYIGILIQELKTKGGMCLTIANLIEYDLHLCDKCKHINLYRAISKDGYKGLMAYFSKSAREAKQKSTLNSIEYGGKLYPFKLIGEVDNYYILFHHQTGIRAVLPKELSITNGKAIIHAMIYKYDESNNVFYVNQSPLPKRYKEPPFLNNNSIVEVSFCLRNSRLIPKLRNHTDLFKISVSNINCIDSYKMKYKAIVKKQISKYRYLVEVVDLA